MNRLLFILVMITFFKVKGQNDEKIIFGRIEYIFNLKPMIAKNHWKDFNSKKYDVPLVYYTDSSSYITNPKKDYLKFYKPMLVFQSRKIKIYKMNKRFDDKPFHMETSFDSDDSTAQPVLPVPIMKCSSFETTKKKLPETTSTEYWVTMIIHEYFHGFQFSHQPYIKAIMNKSSEVFEDSLAVVYKNNNWFQVSVKKENEFLLKAIKAPNRIEIKNYVDSFFVARSERRLETKSKLNFGIDEYEKIYETMEGTARYIEYKLQVDFATKKPDEALNKLDTAYHSYQVFKNYKIENDPWLYTAGKRYFYATGFNLVRLLDKLNIEYKKSLFNKGGLSLEEILLLNKQKI